MYDVVAVVAALTCAALLDCVYMCVCKKSRQNKGNQESNRERDRERLHWKVNRGRKKNRLTGQQIMLRYILRAGMLCMMYIHMYVRMCPCVSVFNLTATIMFSISCFTHTHTHALPLIRVWFVLVRMGSLCRFTFTYISPKNTQIHKNSPAHTLVQANTMAHEQQKRKRL